MSEEDDYELVLTPPARRAPSDRLPETVATAVIDFITTALVQNPRRAGKPLRGELAGIYSARRGTYRLLYRLHEQDREVIVVRIEHRRDSYRPRLTQAGTLPADDYVAPGGGGTAANAISTIPKRSSLVPPSRA